MELLAIISLREEIPERGRKPASQHFDHNCQRRCISLPRLHGSALATQHPHAQRHPSEARQPLTAAALEGFPPEKPPLSRFAPFLVTFQASSSHSPGLSPLHSLFGHVSLRFSSLSKPCTPTALRLPGSQVEVRRRPGRWKAFHDFAT